MSGGKAKPGCAFLREYSSSSPRARSSTAFCALSFLFCQPLPPRRVQLRLPALLADVALDEVDLLDGDEELLALRVLELDVVPLVSRRADPVDAEEPADAVVHVHHEVPGGKLDEALDRRAPRRADRARDAPLPAEDLVLLDDEHAAGRQRETGREALREDLHVQVAQDVAQPVRLHVVHGEDEDRVAVPDRGFHLLAEEGEVPEERPGPVRGQLENRGRPGPALRGGRGGQRREVHPAGHPGLERREIQEDLLRPRHDPLCRAGPAEQLQVLLAQRGRARGQALLVHEEHGGVRPEVVQDRELACRAQGVVQLCPALLGIVEQPLDGLVHLARLEALGDQRRAGGGSLLLAEAHLPAGSDRDLLHRLGGRLVQGIEAPDTLDLVEVQGDARCQLVAGHEHVDDLAADRHLAVDADRGDPQVACPGQAIGRLLGVQPVAPAHRQDPGRKSGRLGHGREQGPQGGDEQEPLTREQPAQHAHPLPEHRREGARGLVGCHAPPGQEHRARAGQVGCATSAFSALRAFEVLQDALRLPLGRNHDQAGSRALFPAPALCSSPRTSERYPPFGPWTEREGFPAPSAETRPWKGFEERKCWSIAFRNKFGMDLTENEKGKRELSP